MREPWLSDTPSLESWDSDITGGQAAITSDSHVPIPCRDHISFYYIIQNMSLHSKCCISFKGRAQTQYVKAATVDHIRAPPML